MYPELFSIGPITIHSFGLMAMLGFMIPTLLLRREFVENKIDPELANNIGVGAIVGGFLGARIYFIFEHWSDFLNQPWEMIFSGAGFVWYGGLLGGFLGVYIVIYNAQMSGVRAADFVLPLILLGYAFGRLGCHLAGDGDYGPPSDLPWAMAYTNGVIPTNVPVHPTPLYDLILSLLFFGLIWLNRKKVDRVGMNMSYALIGLGVERFITEFFRTTPKVAFGWLTFAQIISICLITGGLWFIFLGPKRYIGGK